MYDFTGKKLILGVTGGIAAYKAAYLASSLVKAGADVHVAMTKSARQLVGPATFWALTSNPVLEDMFEKPAVQKISHVTLTESADAFLVVPATANIIAKIAHGIADDMLSTMALVAHCPMIIAPAMNCNMYLNQVTQDNLTRLRELGKIIIEPDSGRLACGDTGVGRLVEPDEIVKLLASILCKPMQDYAGRKVLVSAGPTQEAIDPVRFISNKSSGKMGYALAEAAVRRGAEVVLVSGPVSIPAPAGVNLVDVVGVQQMHDEIIGRAQQSDVFISAAAPADFIPPQKQSEKIKKQQSITLELTKSPDILAELGANKGKTVLVGFAAETQNLLENAQAKLKSKNLDLIVANDVSEATGVFGGDTNTVILIPTGAQPVYLDEMPKTEVADKILDYIRTNILMEVDV